MRVPVAVAQVPVCWSVRRNVGTVLDAIGSVGAGTVLVLPECALSGYDDERSCGTPSTWPRPGTATSASNAAI